MSGGIAYVYDPKDKLEQLSNLDTFELEKLEIEEDVDELKLLEKTT
ncbi:MAG: hypothetical protein CM1200mP12_19000 [Gammaproteobacteria bacterium]|nr:MAG: hypothetical protein CM1200mP12_19000 [Gammaproteobacteria bacterium]